MRNKIQKNAKKGFFVSVICAIAVPLVKIGIDSVEKSTGVEVGPEAEATIIAVVTGTIAAVVDAIKHRQKR